MNTEIKNKETKYTSGIWHDVYEILGKDPGTFIVNEDDKKIAKIYRNMPLEELKANAKLISAAPELLEALKFCQSVIKSQGMFDLSERMAFDKAQEAIKKAI